MGTLLQKYCEAAIATFKSQTNAAKLVNHAVTSGAIREQLLKDFLSAHLPQLVTIVSGQIFDANDKLSKQQDVVLVSKSMPRLPFASNQDLIYSEGVVATVEVKTALTTAGLKATCENIATVKELNTEGASTSAIGKTDDWPTREVLTAIFTYEGAVSLSSVESQLADVPDAHLPDMVLDLTRGLLVRNHGKLLKLKQEPSAQGLKTPRYIAETDSAAGLAFFLTVLTEISGTLTARSVDWRRYLPKN